MSAKLLYAHPPPGTDSDSFNAESRDLVKLALDHKLRTKRAPVTRVGKKSDTFFHLPEGDSDEEIDDDEFAAAPSSVMGGDGTESMASFATTNGGRRPRQSARAAALDRDYFAASAAGTGPSSKAFFNGIAANIPGQTGRQVMYPHQRQLGDDGKKLSTRKVRELESIGAVPAASGKKHFKGNKRQKQRSGAGYE